MCVCSTSGVVCVVVVLSVDALCRSPRYSEALEGLTDDFDPMPSALARAVVQQELCDGAGERFEDVFESWVDEPLGSASVAQVHRAKLTAAYGGAEVAVKVQRPAIEAKLLSDLSTLKALAKAARDALPVDYYAVFCELETQLADESRRQRLGHAREGNPIEDMLRFGGWERVRDH